MRKSSSFLLRFCIPILFVLGFSTVISSCMRKDESSIILGTALPELASEADYRISYGWDGPSGILCAKVSKAVFLEIVEEIRGKRKLEQKKYPQFDELFEFSPANLKCWMPTNPDNEDTYVAITSDYFMVIKYEGGIMFVVFNST
jgi:hypothetical protein